MNYQNLLTQKVQNLKPSGIRRFFDIAGTLDDVITLAIGEPDFTTPWHIRQEGIKSLTKGKTFYSPNSGFEMLREEISNYLNRRFNVDYHPQDEVLVTVGGSEAIDLAIRALVNPGDEVLIPEPCFVCYDPITELVGGVPVPIQTKEEDDFRLTPEELKEKITDKTKILILPFPNNPTGAVMRKEHLEAIAEVLKDTNIMVLSDEIYAELTYGDAHHVTFPAIEGMRERTILVNGFSKAYAMTGWRLGYACGPKEIIAQMRKIHQYGIMCAPTMAQYAAIEGLRNGDDDIEYMREKYDMRRKYIVNGFRELGFPTFEPEGAFYCFPCIKRTGLSSEEFCEKLLYSKKVAVVPGTAFGASGEGYIRVSYSYSLDHIKEALSRIRAFLDELEEEKNN